MGYLTTITFRNDSVHSIKDNKDRLVEVILDATCGAGGMHNGCAHDEYVGSADLICQRTRHADEHTVYVHMGNTVQEMNSYAPETRRLLEKCPSFFDSCVTHLEQEVRYLKKMKKEYLEKQVNNSPEGLEKLRGMIRAMPDVSSDNPTAKIAKLKEIRAWTGKSLQDAIEFLETV